MKSLCSNLLILLSLHFWVYFCGLIFLLVMDTDFLLLVYSNFLLNGRNCVFLLLNTRFCCLLLSSTVKSVRLCPSRRVMYLCMHLTLEARSRALLKWAWGGLYPRANSVFLQWRGSSEGLCACPRYSLQTRHTCLFYILEFSFLRSQ